MCSPTLLVGINIMLSKGANTDHKKPTKAVKLPKPSFQHSSMLNP